MKHDVINLDNESVGSVELDKALFDVEIREDILHRVVSWQLAKRREGNHKTKTVSEVSGTTKKPWAQKGGGRARAGTVRATQFKGGGISFGPVVRSHTTDLPKKIRKLGLRTAVASKIADKNLIILDDAKLDAPKTKDLKAKLEKLGWESALIIAGNEVDENLALASRNLHTIDILPVQGANVYDMLRAEKLVLTKEAVKLLEARVS
ncbi:MAG: 50S ribosomal protein L4 [Alphaproteobacteria bacterium]|nr:50S ribosomal protein L4 [Alphaproteobacteria bacterium]